MLLRAYQPDDCKALAALFFHTVHAVNARDYRPEQLNAWADGYVDLAAWDRSFRQHFTIVAVDGSGVIGFGDIDGTGYLDRLYVHAAHQREGIAAAICDLLERHAAGTVTAHASITAKPFFEKRGYRIRKEQQVERHGVLLTNYIMEKRLQQTASR